MIKLISLDADGTLLDPAGAISPGAKAAAAKARAAGIRVVINTGRAVQEAFWFAEQIGGDMLVSAAGGALVADGIQKRTIRRWNVPEPSGRKALEICLGWQVQLMIFAGDNVLVDTNYKAFLEKHFPFPAFHAAAIVTDDPLGYMQEHNLPLIKIHGELDPACYPLNKLAALPGVALTASSDHDFELLADGADKGRALALLASLYEIPLEQCAAVGDSENDLPAFQAAGISIAMGNSAQNIKNAAARIAPSNREDGVSWAILSCLN